MDNTKEFTHISLCAGYGGIDLGLKRVIPNLRTIAFSEIEAFVTANLVSKIESGLLDSAPIWTDLKTFPFKEFHGRVDILSGGFPCQPFSGAGRRGADEDPRHLFPHVMRGIRESAPRLVFLENVEGMYSSKLKGEGWSDPAGTPVLLHVLRELERGGYTATSGTFSASETGAPHLRKRCFIMAVKEGWSRDLELSKSIKQSVYPSKRGLEQYWWEPPRVTQLGDSKHHGSLDTEKRGNNDQTSFDCEERSIKPIESKRAGGREDCGDLQGVEELGDTKCGNEESRRESRALSEKSRDREADQSTWSSVTECSRTEELDNTDCKRLQRYSPTGTSERSKGRKVKTRHDATSGTLRDSVQGQAKSSVGRDINGSTDWMDNAELYESFDNRTDELRMLGNGVVPDTAATAFRVLWEELENSYLSTKR